MVDPDPVDGKLAHDRTGIVPQRRHPLARCLSFFQLASRVAVY
jgi:hypothetical protein